MAAMPRATRAIISSGVVSNGLSTSSSPCSVWLPSRSSIATRSPLTALTVPISRWRDFWFTHTITVSPTVSDFLDMSLRA